MFDIQMNENNEILISGRFDAAQVKTAEAFFGRIQTTCRVNLSRLEYISSAGLGVLLGAQKNLKDEGHQLILSHLNDHIRDIFTWARFDIIFKIE